MKLRIRDNSIRLRLTQNEVERLARDGRVASAVEFPGGNRLEYAVVTAAGPAAPAADYTGDCLCVTVPEAVVREWASSDAVSIAGRQALAADALSILVEKDYACLTPRAGEDDSDLFPHPLADVESC